ncbi:hypothetical protein JTE90_007068 [Oedothorax gibbosus]|uniref:Uncharacterized protein n=1 Tax=Oedothorax gibbosus TaxID=931172 RepID=A0AAV6U2C3_9ARAC|nr:hypothetical protein JTE90_007068 [Oedothorax gibbosus]
MDVMSDKTFSEYTNIVFEDLEDNTRKVLEDTRNSESSLSIPSSMARSLIAKSSPKTEASSLGARFACLIDASCRHLIADSMSPIFLVLLIFYFLERGGPP